MMSKPLIDWLFYTFITLSKQMILFLLFKIKIFLSGNLLKKIMVLVKLLKDSKRSKIILIEVLNKLLLKNIIIFSIYIIYINFKKI